MTATQVIAQFASPPNAITGGFKPDGSPAEVVIELPPDSFEAWVERCNRVRDRMGIPGMSAKDQREGYARWLRGVTQRDEQARFERERAEAELAGYVSKRLTNNPDKGLGDVVKGLLS